VNVCQTHPAGRTGCVEVGLGDGVGVGLGDALIDVLGFVTGDVLWLAEACGLGWEDGLVEGLGVVAACPCDGAVAPEWPPAGVPLLPGLLLVVSRLCAPAPLVPLVPGDVGLCSASGVCE
jgi:hypothetical protein